MNFVEFVYSTALSFLDSVSESQFGAVASALGTTAQLAATLVAALVIVNMATQTRPMLARDSIALLVRLLLVNLFMFNWTQFDALADAMFAALDMVSGALITSVVSEGGIDDLSSGSVGSPLIGIAGAIDALIAQMGEFANSVSASIGIVGGTIFQVTFAILMALLAGAASLILVASRVTITVLIAIAPLMIMLTMFDATKSYFERWLAALVTLSLYPLVIAGIFSTIVGVGTTALDQLAQPEDLTSIGEAIPVFMVVVLSILLTAMTPIIVSMISGSIHVRDKVTEAAGLMAVAATKMAAVTGGQAAAKGTRVVAKDAAGYLGNPVTNARQSASEVAAMINRMQARTARFVGRK